MAQSTMRSQAPADVLVPPFDQIERASSHYEFKTREGWQLRHRFWLSFLAISLANLAASFEATTFSVALPVELSVLITTLPLSKG